MIWILIIVLVVFTYVAVLTSGGIAAYQELLNQGYSIIIPEYILYVLIFPFLPEVGALWGNIALGWLLQHWAATPCFAERARKPRERIWRSRGSAAI